jgi:tRNA dimethylallyltransferase
MTGTSSIAAWPMPVICGATASGKSSLAVQLAHAFTRHTGAPARILAADAYQIYRGMDIGTAKPTLAERDGLPHALIDLVEPTQTFTVEHWLSHAEAEIAACRAAGILPIVVGGTHLYIKALLEGLFEGPGADPAYRATLAALPPAELRAMLERIDPPTAARLHPNDLRRTIRALEVHHLTATPISTLQAQWGNASTRRSDARLICLHWPTDALNRRINARVRAMRADGLEAEVRTLAPLLTTPASLTAREALGYKQLLPLLSPQRPRPATTAEIDDAFEQIKIHTRRFAKNQRTWLKQLRITPGAINLDLTDEPPPDMPTLATHILAQLQP